MNNVLEKGAEDEVVIECRGLVCEVGFGVSLPGEAPQVVMFAPKYEKQDARSYEPTDKPVPASDDQVETQNTARTVTKRKYADFLVKSDPRKFSIKEIEAAPAAVEEKEPQEQAPEPSPAKSKGLFGKR